MSNDLPNNNNNNNANPTNTAANNHSGGNSGNYKPYRKNKNFKKKYDRNLKYGGNNLTNENVADDSSDRTERGERKPYNNKKNKNYKGKNYKPRGNVAAEQRDNPTSSSSGNTNLNASQNRNNNYNANKNARSNTNNGSNNNQNANQNKGNNYNKNSGGKNKGKYNKNKYNKNRNNVPQKSIEELEAIYLTKRQNDGQEKPICQICNEKIDIVEMAIRYKNTDELCHFDCIIDEIKSKNTLDRSESVAYLGGGTFGVVKTMTTKNSKKFFVRKRIVYEKKDYYDYKLEHTES